MVGVAGEVAGGVVAEADLAAGGVGDADQAVERVVAGLGVAAAGAAVLERPAGGVGVLADTAA